MVMLLGWEPWLVVSGSLTPWTRFFDDFISRWSHTTSSSTYESTFGLSAWWSVWSRVGFPLFSLLLFPNSILFSTSFKIRIKTSVVREGKRETYFEFAHSPTHPKPWCALRKSITGYDKHAQGWWWRKAYLVVFVANGTSHLSDFSISALISDTESWRNTQVWQQERNRTKQCMNSDIINRETEIFSDKPLHQDQEIVGEDEELSWHKQVMHCTACPLH